MRLYPVAAIQAGHVPSESGFAEAVIELDNLVEGSSGIKGAVVGGSIARGMATATSDFDGFIVYDKKYEPQVLHQFDTFADLLRRRHIPYEDLHLIPNDIWTGSDHRLSVAYLRSLRQSAATHPEFSFGQDILSTIGLPRERLMNNASAYTSQKLQKLSYLRTWSKETWSSQWLELAEEVVNTPFYCVLRLMDSHGRDLPDYSSGYGLAGSILAFLQLYESDAGEDIAEVIATLQSIESQKQAAKQALDGILVGESPDEYQWAVTKLVGLAPLALTVLQWTLAEVARLADGQ